MKQQQMFEKILVANRGEIAVRIMRSAQELDIKTLAIYEETDKDAFHITQGDEAICVGPGPRKDYLNIEGIITLKALSKQPEKPGLRPSIPAMVFWQKIQIFPKPVLMLVWFSSARLPMLSGIWEAK